MASRSVAPSKALAKISAIGEISATAALVATKETPQNKTATSACKRGGIVRSCHGARLPRLRRGVPSRDRSLQRLRRDAHRSLGGGGRRGWGGRARAARARDAAERARPRRLRARSDEIGRASCRERV